MTDTVRITDSYDLLSVVPITLGFHPSESVVVVTLIEQDGSIIRAHRTVAGRDQWLLANLGHAAAAVPSLVAAVRHTPAGDQATAHLASVPAALAYRTGDGSLAQVAIDRALASEPSHSLARLLVALVSSGLPPADLDEILGA